MTTATKATVETVDGQKGVRCVCGKHHPFGMYVVAQTAMGHTVTMTCDCGHKVDVQGRAGSYIIVAKKGTP